METSEPLSIESFSYRWLINLKPSFETLEKTLRNSFDASDETTFIEMDPRLTPSKRFLGDAHDFNFDIPISQSPIALVHADELLSNGKVIPLFINPSKMEKSHNNTSDTESSVPLPPLPISSESSGIIRFSSNPIHFPPIPFLRRCRKSSKRIFQKYLGFLRPLYRKVQSSSRVGNRRAETSIDERARVVRSWGHSQSEQTSPRISYATGDWCDIESSIYEAILYCKKSDGRERCFSA